MQANSNFQKSVSSFLLFVFFALNFTAAIPNEAHAIYEGVRKTGTNCAEATGNAPCYTNDYGDSCDVGSFDFNPYINPSIDYNMDITNKACIGYLVGSGVSLFIASQAAQLACSSANKVPKANVGSTSRTASSVASGIAGAGRTVATQVGRVAPNAAATVGAAVTATFVGAELAALCSEVAVKCAIEILSPSGPSQGYKCCIGTGILVGTTAAAISALASIWGIAKRSFEGSKICGDGWFVWKKNSTTQTYIKQKGLYAKCLDIAYNNKEYDTDITQAKCATFGLDKKRPAASNITSYREFLYGGYEYGHSGSNACKTPETLETQLGYKGGNQRYYMRGPGEQPNYACTRFLMNGLKTQEEVQAFECCKNASQTQICIKSDYATDASISGFGGMDPVQSGAIIGAAATVAVPGAMPIGAAAGATIGAIMADGAIQSSAQKVAFCEVGGNCFAGAVEYAIYEAKTSSHYICAKTLSVCPYDHLLSGGTEEQQLNIKNQSAGHKNIVANFCQYMRHCSKIPDLPDVRITSLSQAYISPACKNMVGDSQQSYQYAGTLLPFSNRSFSAPMVQCFKETMENNFLRIAGGAVCINDNEKPDEATGKCPSGNLLMKGQKYEKPFFIKIQDRLKGVIKMVLVFALLMLGIAALFALPGEYFNKKIVLGFILKLGLVVYFTLGDAWQGMFFDSLINVPAQMMDLTFRPFYDQNDQDHNDGCNFPRYDYSKKNESNSSAEKFKNPQYPEGKAYLRPWDIIDCKIVRALGYGPEVSVPNIAIMIVTGVFFSSIGVIFFLSSFGFFFLLLYITIRAMHIFMLSTVLIILLIYVSPITILAAMFEKTKSIFENWWKQLFGAVFQPMILFAYMGMLFTVLDVVFIGSARFEAGGSYLEGTTTKQDNEGRLFPKAINCSSYTQNNETFNPENDSIYCMFNLKKFSNYDGFEPFSVMVPVLRSMNKDKVNSLFRLAVLMFVFVTFLEKITFIAKKLVGGVELKSDWKPQIHTKIAGLMSGVQSRALRGLKKGAGAAGSKAAGFVRGKADKYSDAKPSEGGGDIALNSNKSSDNGEIALNSNTTDKGGVPAPSDKGGEKGDDDKSKKS